MENLRKYRVKGSVFARLTAKCPQWGKLMRDELRAGGGFLHIYRDSDVKGIAVPVYAADTARYLLGCPHIDRAALEEVTDEKS